MERIREMREMRSTQPAPTNLPRPTRNSANLVILVWVAGWVFPNLLVSGRVAKKAKTRPNQPVPTPSNKYGSSLEREK
jgi:hypothetical protein